MRKAFIWIALLGLMFVILAGSAFSGSEIHPLEPVDVSSPRATLESFIQNSRKAAEAYKAGNYHDAKKFARRLLQTLPGVVLLSSLHIRGKTGFLTTSLLRY